MQRGRDCSVLQNTSDLLPANLLKLIPKTKKSAVGR